MYPEKRFNGVYPQARLRRGRDVIRWTTFPREAAQRRLKARVIRRSQSRGWAVIGLEKVNRQSRSSTKGAD